MSRLILTLRLVLPSVWLGALVALSFIEAPLKFLAPGITVPLGLGIGRLVFTALAIIGFAMAVAMTVLGVLRPRLDRVEWALLAGVWLMLLVQSVVIRPSLNARSDLVVAGVDPGPSTLHYWYIATDLVLVLLLLAWIVVQCRRLPLTRIGGIVPAGRE